MLRIVAEGSDPGPPAELAHLLSVSEIDHRIANNLAMVAGLVRMRAKAAAGATALEAEALLRETAIQIDAVSHLHGLLSHRPSDSALNICDYLRDICGTLEGAFAGRLTLEQDYGAECILPRDRALPIGLIVAEAVTNSAKYAHPAQAPGRVLLSCAVAPDGTLAITVADDGVGFPEGFEPATDGGLGMRVIRGLAQQLGATWRFESGPLGLTFRMHAPIAQRAHSARSS
jgi:two-component sensor histidine kinase